MLDWGAGTGGTRSARGDRGDGYTVVSMGPRLVTPMTEVPHVLPVALLVALVVLVGFVVLVVFASPARSRNNEERSGRQTHDYPKSSHACSLLWS
jgi:hypothetical protein